MTPSAWHTLTPAEALRQLEVEPQQGLSATCAAERLQYYGANTLREQGGRSPLSILWEQVTSTMALILTAAAVLSGRGGIISGMPSPFWPLLCCLPCWALCRTIELNGPLPP